jgi:hypothetical protein
MGTIKEDSSMKRFLGVTVGLLMLLAAGGSQAAEVEQSQGTINLVFHFDGLSNLDLDGYNGSYGVGMRYFMQDGLAIRPGARVSVMSFTDDSEGASGDDPSDNVFGLSLVLEKYRDVGIESLAPWIGVGASFDVANIESSGVAEKLKFTQFGAFVAAGFQWGFAKGVSLGGDYEAGVSIASEEREDEDGETFYDMSVTEFGFNTMALYLSVGL